MDVFDFQNHLFHRLSETHAPERPLNLELHPGPHCDAYRCPHCYGFGQKIMPGATLSVAEIDAALAEVAEGLPTVNVSGVATEPLTHPDAAGLIRAVRRRGLPLGLYTKGRHLDAAVRAALVEPSGAAETFVTISLGATDAPDYAARHGIDPGKRDRFGAAGRDYFDIVLDNVANLRRARDAAGAKTKIRAAFLLFADNANEEFVARALDLVGPYADMLRFTLPQLRNDGELPGVLLADSAARLAGLKSAFAGHPKVRIMEASSPGRAKTFRRCRAQRFQTVIDRAGHVFPCPETATRAFAHLSIGNIRERSLREILAGATRRDLFARDVDELGCLVCNRRDEAINTKLAALDEAFSEMLAATPA
jgi:radical SAM protein with 4Fe4S-binding SPASM domain